MLARGARRRRAADRTRCDSSPAPAAAATTDVGAAGRQADAPVDKPAAPPPTPPTKKVPAKKPKPTLRHRRSRRRPRRPRRRRGAASHDARRRARRRRAGRAPTSQNVSTGGDRVSVSVLHEPHRQRDSEALSAAAHRAHRRGAVRHSPRRLGRSREHSARDVVRRLLVRHAGDGRGRGRRERQSVRAASVRLSRRHPSHHLPLLTLAREMTRLHRAGPSGARAARDRAPAVVRAQDTTFKWRHAQRRVRSAARQGRHRRAADRRRVRRLRARDRPARSRLQRPVLGHRDRQRGSERASRAPGAAAGSTIRCSRTSPRRRSFRSRRSPTGLHVALHDVAGAQS